MNFSLSQADRDLLNQTIAKVNALTLSKKQGEQKNQKTKDHTYVELSENVLDGGEPTKFWYGSEVGFDAFGDTFTKSYGRVWDVNSKGLIILGSPSVNDVVRVEPTTLDSEEPVWIGNKTAGGGGGVLWAELKTLVSGAEYTADILDSPSPGTTPTVLGAKAIALNLKFGEIDIGQAEPFMCSYDATSDAYYFEPPIFGA